MWAAGSGGSAQSGYQVRGGPSRARVRGASCHTHLPVCHVLAALAGRAGPALIPGPGPAVLRPLLGVALLVGGLGVVVVVVVVVPVLPVLGPAPLLVPLFGWQVARLGGHTQVCPQAWAGWSQRR